MPAIKSSGASADLQQAMADTQQIEQLTSTTANSRLTTNEQQETSRINGQEPNPHQALFDSIPQTGLKCDILFLVIKNRIQEELEYVKKLRVVFQFNITKNGEPAATWTCDTRTTLSGDIYRSAVKPGLKADCILTVDDDDWVKIMVGKLNPQRAFMMSKFKIKGNIMLLQKLHALWFDLRKKGRTPELDLIQEIMVNEPLMVGLKSEAMAIELVQRIVKKPFLFEKINATIQMDILKQGKLMTQYLIGMYAGKKPEFRRLFNADLPLEKQYNKLNKSEEKQTAMLRPDVIFTIEDDDLVLIIYGIYKVDQVISMGRLKIDGKEELVERAKMLLEQPPIMARL